MKYAAIKTSYMYVDVEILFDFEVQYGRLLLFFTEVSKYNIYCIYRNFLWGKSSPYSKNDLEVSLVYI